MPRSNSRDATRNATMPRYALRLLLIAVAIVATLIFVNSSDWFKLRPVSGAANAISQATDAPPANAPARP